MSKIEVNTVDVQCGSTLTLGSSGKTVQLASGASQSGFGRTGTVDWQTTPKTANFTAVNGEGYFVNTTSGAVTMTMPSGSAGAIVSIQDYNKTFDTNNLTVAPASGEKINGGDASANLIIETEGQGLTFVYVDSTVGWKTVHDNEFTAGGSNYISATGGTITCCGDFKIHTFTGPGTFTVSATGAPANNTLEYIVVAGGGGAGFCGGNAMGGAGAGGFRLAAPSLAPLTYPGKPLSATGLTATAAAFPITVGAGGSPGGPTLGSQGTAGSTSTFSTISSAGGAKGSKGSVNSGVGCAGGSGAGGAGGGYNRAAGAGNTPPVSPPQGQPGGNSGNNPAYPDHASGGGGGAICAGAQGRSISNNASGKGGDGAGIPTAFGSNGVPCGSFRYYAGGGAGEYYAPVTSEKAPGGKGGGGNGGGPGQDGTANTGGGGAGGGTPGSAGGAGGSGIIIIRYKFQN